MSKRVARWSLPVLLAVLLIRPTVADDQAGDEPKASEKESTSRPDDTAGEEAETGSKTSSPMGPQLHLKGLVPLSPKKKVWIDPKRKIVVVDGKVCLRRGVLELFACPRGTKEHEAVVSVDAKASTIHAGLLAVGAMQGSPVQFAPEYKSATGTEIEVWVLWKDVEGKNRKVPAQHWIRNIKTEKAMTERWVFAGSGFYVDERTGERFYKADGSGDLVCVSNFSTATLDLPVKSSAEAADLLYECFTERIPARDTQIRLVFIPKPTAPKDDAPAKKAD